MGDGHRIWVLWKSGQCSYLLSYFSSPTLFCFAWVSQLPGRIVWPAGEPWVDCPPSTDVTNVSHYAGSLWVLRVGLGPSCVHSERFTDCCLVTARGAFIKIRAGKVREALQGETEIWSPDARIPAVTLELESSLSRGQQMSQCPFL